MPEKKEKPTAYTLPKFFDRFTLKQIRLMFLIAAILAGVITVIGAYLLRG